MNFEDGSGPKPGLKSQSDFEYDFQESDKDDELLLLLGQEDTQGKNYKLWMEFNFLLVPETLISR